jgi:hypothetical protein
MHTHSTHAHSTHAIHTRSVLYGEQSRFFDDEIRPNLKHNRRGLVGMASGGKNLNASQVRSAAAAGCCCNCLLGKLDRLPSISALSLA